MKSSTATSISIYFFENRNNLAFHLGLVPPLSGDS